MNFTTNRDEEAEALATPLLAGEEEQPSEVDVFGAQLREFRRNNNGGMVETPSPTSEMAGSGFSSMMMMMGGPSSSASSSHGRRSVRGSIASCLHIRTMADALPSILKPIVTNGKLSIAFFLGAQIVLFLSWLPFWICSFLVGETGVYFTCVATIVVVGRGILRMIAFPGSSHRVVSEMEKEFTKYSVRVLTSSATSLVELSEAIMAPSTSMHYHYNVRSLWKRANSYRHRVLAVYEEVLKTTLGTIPAHMTSDLNKHGNNVLVGDIGNLSGLTPEAISDGRILLNHLETVLVTVESLEDQMRSILLEEQNLSPSDSARHVASSLIASATELCNFVESLKPPSSSSSSEGDDTEMLSTGEMQTQQQPQPNGMMDTIKTGISAILPMLDPPPHTSIFGFDVLRGCVLSRYKGARQLWVPRPGGGRIDCMHIPAVSKSESQPTNNMTAGASSTRNSKAVLYCNPNAGLIEVATGMSLAGGNVSYETDGVVNDNCWTDFYTNEGFDIYMFNYAGFGRSYGRSAFCGLCGKEGTAEPHEAGAWGRIKRIIYGLVFDFRPTPSSLRADGLAVANHVLSLGGVESLVIHGESIGGVAASGTARALTESHQQRSKVKLLLCDRTFCNLEAVAQRLVGGWSGYAIRLLAPLWSTDVLGDFLAASCPKVVATDAADAIIADPSSLKAGISYWKEIGKSVSKTKGIAWKMDAPLHYKMADWENVGVTASKYGAPPNARMNPPVWPSDKHVSINEAFHFAACTKRIGKLASMEKKRSQMLSASTATNDEEGGETCQAPVYLVWKHLGCCEGLCGAPLGVTVKDGFDTTVSWLSSLCVFGGQTIIEGMEHRNHIQGAPKLHELGLAIAEDFDCRPPDYEQQESDAVVHPKPIPEVLEAIRTIVAENPNDAILNNGELAKTIIVAFILFMNHLSNSSFFFLQRATKFPLCLAPSNTSCNGCRHQRRSNLAGRIGTSTQRVQ